MLIIVCVTAYYGAIIMNDGQIGNLFYIDNSCFSSPSPNKNKLPLESSQDKSRILISS